MKPSKSPFHERFFCLMDSSKTDLVKSQIPSSNEIALSPRIFSCPSDVALGRHDLFTKGIIIPMELSSAIAVLLLSLKENDHFLDLCCAPGTKLAFAASFLDASQGASCTGIDVSKHRICTARSMMKRFHIACVRLYLMDGRNFWGKPHSVEFTASNSGKSFKELYSHSQDCILPFWSSSDVRKRPGKLIESGLYDKILVDVECTHDGSTKHIQKNGPPDLSTEKILKLSQLQFQLLQHAFELLVPGGFMIYSTCSLMREQNEHVVEKFLGVNRGSVEIANDEYFVREPGDLNAYCYDYECCSFGGGSVKFLKFVPELHGIGGLFVAKLRKKK